MKCWWKVPYYPCDWPLRNSSFYCNAALSGKAPGPSLGKLPKVSFCCPPPPNPVIPGLVPPYSSAFPLLSYSPAPAPSPGPCPDLLGQGPRSKMYSLRNLSIGKHHVIERPSPPDGFLCFPSSVCPLWSLTKTLIPIIWQWFYGLNSYKWNHAPVTPFVFHLAWYPWEPHFVHSARSPFLLVAVDYSWCDNTIIYLPPLLLMHIWVILKFENILKKE